MQTTAQLWMNAQNYAKLKHIAIDSKDSLGRGNDGSVWKSSAPSAVKALHRRTTFATELECYQRLWSARVQNINGFAVPILVGYNSKLMIIEMSIVQPPFLLDFGKVYLDHRPADIYDSEQMAEAHAEWRSRFGRNWPRVLGVLIALEKYGIYYVDPQHGNIDTGDDDDDDYLAGKFQPIQE